MALKLITGPSVEPVTLAMVKQQLREDSADFDDLIELYIQSARQFIDGKDGYLQRALVTQTWELWLDSFPCNELRIPLPPLQSIESIKYDDTDGNEQTVSAINYTVDSASEPGWILPDSATPWPTTFDGVNSVRVRFVAGYPASADSPPDLTANIPSNIKLALLLYIGTMYAHRETIVVGQTAVALPWSAEQLLNYYRIWV